MFCVEKLPRLPTPLRIHLRVVMSSEVVKFVPSDAMRFVSSFEAMSCVHCRLTERGHS